jgi:cation transporter-like permease
MLYTEDEKKFIEYWRENRDYQATLAYQLLFGLPIGLLFSLPIVINFLLGRLWYKRADAVGLSQFNHAVLIIAVMVISVFIAIVNRRFRWEKLEQQYLELLARKKAEDEANA